MDSDDLDVLETLEIDLDIDECAEILEAHGVEPTADLMHQLWHWKEGPFWPSEGDQR